jgi:GWxTD domain-containing protein
MLLPVKDLDKEKLKITIAGFRDSLVFESENSFVSNIDFFECSGDVAITGGKGKPVKIFLFSNFSNSLREGEYKVIILDSGEEEVSFPINVLWINKPGSMFNPERAISFLSFIENEETVDSLLDFEDSFYPKILYDYWQPKDPTPETAFNELMAEYYKRIDYARTAFATLKGNDGEKTDRAKILVRFGEPDDVTRSVTEDGFVTEIWNYGKLQKKFIFVDTSGKGKFELESAQ